MILRLRSVLDMLTREYRGERVLIVAPPGDRQLPALPARAPRRGADPRRSTGSATCRTAASRRTSSIRRAAGTASSCLRARQLRRAAARGRRAGHRRARRAGGAEVVRPMTRRSTIDAALLRELAAAAARRRRRQGGARPRARRRRQRRDAGRRRCWPAIAALRAGAGKLAVATVGERRARARARACPKRASSRCPRREAAASPPTRSHARARCSRSVDAVLIGPGLQDEAATLRASRDALLERSATRRVVLDALRDGRRAADVRTRSSAAPLLHAARRRDGAPDRTRQGRRSSADPARDRARGGAALERGRRAEGRDDRTSRARRRLLAPRRRQRRARHLGIGRRARRPHRRPRRARRSLEQAAAWGVALHARAGEALAERLGPLGYLARELPAEMPRLMHRLAH